MERYRVIDKVTNITESTVIMPERGFGGWLAANEGTADAKVLGFTLAPGEGFNNLDSVPVGSIYDSPIEIIITPGAVIRLLRRQATPIK